MAPPTSPPKNPPTPWPPWPEEPPRPPPPAGLGAPGSPAVSAMAISFLMVVSLLPRPPASHPGSPAKSFPLLPIRRRGESGYSTSGEKNTLKMATMRKGFRSLRGDDEDQHAGLMGRPADEDHAAPAEPERGGEEVSRPVGDPDGETDLVPLRRKGGRPHHPPPGELELPRLPDREGAPLPVEHPVGSVVEHGLELSPDDPEGRVHRTPLVGGVDRPDLDGDRVGGS